ncbi:MAG: response regulator [Candidatus Omnitrophica bacterium]|nr:Sensor histidine kinase RcsC [bacterium]NUN97044.1 response regulator [Candidatus Omnitrophota bacterium]
MQEKVPPATDRSILKRILFRASLIACGLPLLIAAALLALPSATRGQLGWPTVLTLSVTATCSVLGLYLLIEILFRFFPLSKGLKRLLESTDDGAEHPSRMTEVSKKIDTLGMITEDFRQSALELHGLIRQLATLGEVTELTSRIPDLKGLLGVVLRKALMATRATKGTILVQEEEGGGLHVLAAEGWSPNIVGPIDPADTLASKVIATGKPLLALDEEGVLAAGGANDPHRYASSSFLIMPLSTTRGTIGALCLSERVGGASFTDHDQQFLAALLAQVGFAMENARMIQQMREAMNHLEETVHRQETLLRDARRKVLHANRLSELGQLIAGVAHELNNPLTSVQGYAQLLLERDEAARDNRWLRTVFDESTRATAIVRNLLNFAHESSPGTSPADLNEVVETVVRLRRYDLRMRNIDISTDLDPSLPAVMGEPARFQQVLLNLINNSVQAMPPEGARKIRLGTTHSDQEVSIWIADTGRGIPEDIRDKVFEPFFTTRTDLAHTGLGLTISRAIIEDLGGALDILSVEGQGTRVTIRLPLVEAPEATAEVRSLLAPLPLRFDHLFALSVDDEPANAELVASILQEIGFRVEIATSGNDAKTRLLHESFDLVVCDLRMPQMDGRLLFRDLKRTRPSSIKRILFTTGDVFDPEARLFAQNNQLRLVAKPFVKEDLLAAVREVFAREPAILRHVAGRR